MRAMRSLLNLLIILAIVGGGAFAIYHFTIQDKVKDTTSATKLCVTERDMVKDAIKQATELHGRSGIDIVDPGTYIHVNTPPKYYSWTGHDGLWAPLPIGTPPC